MESNKSHVQLPNDMGLFDFKKSRQGEWLLAIFKKNLQGVWSFGKYGSIIIKKT